MCLAVFCSVTLSLSVSGGTSSLSTWAHLWVIGALVEWGRCYEGRSAKGTRDK